MTDLERLDRNDLLVPKQISWRRASALVRPGYATLYPFYDRWLGRLQITDKGRAALGEARVSDAQGER
jgi:hypothetical protein